MELTVPVAGGHLWADDTGGDAPVLVMLHPGWGDSSIWLPVIGELPPRYRVIRYDTRGFGRSPAPAAPFSQLGDLAAVLDHRGADRVILVGHSAGGGTALGLALADPGRVRGLLLLAPGVARCAADIAARIPGCQRIAAAGADHLLPLRAPALIAELAARLDLQTA